MKTAVIYARYSSERQTEQSIEGQVRECTEYAKRNDIVIVDTYIDRAMTGTNDNRTDFQRMLKDCTKRAWDIVLVYKLDRFSRNKYEMAMHKKTLRDNGIKLISAKENIPDSPEGIILESLLEGMAEYYSVELAQKVRRGQRESRLKGNYAGGGIPYGYKVEDKKFVVVEHEANIVVRIFELYSAGVFVKDIIKGLTDDGLTYRNGKTFTKNMIYGFLKNERYSGIYTHPTEGVIANMFPRIVSQHLYDTVRAKIDKNKYGKHPADVVYLLKFKMKCGYCGKSICSESGTSQSGTISRYYKCSSRKKARSCKKSIMKKEELEQLVIDTTLKAIGNPKMVDFIVDKIFELAYKRFADNSVLLALENKKLELSKSLNNMLDAIEKGIFTASTKQRIEELENQITEIDDKILIEKSKGKIQITKEDIKRFFNKAIHKEPLQMIDLLIKEIVLFDDKINIYYNYIEKEKPDELEHQAFSIYTEEIEYSKSFGKIKLELFF
jgi:DNA invertase Pin-like site-specific DNA recombinase